MKSYLGNSIIGSGDIIKDSRHFASWYCSLVLLTFLDPTSIGRGRVTETDRSDGIYTSSCELGKTFKQGE